MLKTKVIKKHSAKCWIHESKNERYCFDKVDWAKGHMYFRCNDPDCKFLIRIRFDEIDEFVKSLLN